MKKIILLLLVIIGLSSCGEKAVYNRNCCIEPGGLVVFEGGYVTIPNAFTPNGDGTNDFLIPIAVGVSNYTLTVRLEDETLFVGENEGWDGKVDGSVEAGIYGYIIDIETSDGDISRLLGQICSIPDPAEACINEAERCVFENQFIPDPTVETVGEYDPQTVPSPIFCDE